MVPPLYEFRPMSPADLPLVRNWLAAPHIAQWWGDAAEQFKLVSEDLEHLAMGKFIVVKDECPFGYLQCYDPAAWPDQPFGPQPFGTRGIDQFIGEPDVIERGH